MLRRLSIVPVLLLASFAFAADSAVELGTRISGMYDVSFKPFKDAKTVDRMFPAELLRYTREDKKWTLVFDRAELPHAIPLRDTRTATGVDAPGYLSAAVNQIRSSDPTADVLRTDVLDTGKLRIGIVIAHVRLKPNEHSLMQQAIIEITPRMYYSIVMHTLAPEKIAADNPQMQEAASVFQAIVDSIESIDLSSIRQDQENRLFRTRAMFLNWNQKTILNSLVSERFLRFRRQNDQNEWDEIGYAFVTEQASDALPRAGAKEVPVADPQKAAGVRVGMRMRTNAEPGKSVDIESWMFVSFDRKHEVWSNVSVFSNPAAPNVKDREQWFTEVGASDIEQTRVFDKQLAPGDFKEVDRKNLERKEGDPEMIPFRIVDKYKLLVRTESRNAVAQPIQRELPPFYLPQALGTMLPRLLPLNDPQGYLFASYASDSRQVMMRYVDVGHETTATIGGKTVRAIPVTERLGAEGPPTTHYITTKGEYVGTLSPEQKLEILPTDRDTLLKLWKDANLSQPEAVKQ